MSVYTSLSRDFFESLVKKYNIGALEAVEPIKGGVTNTLYQLQTSEGPYVFTLFESLNEKQLMPYVELMQYLSRYEIPCTTPVENKAGKIIEVEAGKPYILAPYLPGEIVNTPTETHCEQVGRLLAKLHRVGHSFPKKIPNQRSLSWCMNTYNKIKSQLAVTQQRLIESELKRHARINYKALPQGIIHADIFRDNVIFDGDKLTGCIDFYYACTDVLIIDLAIAINDWCLSQRGKAQGLVNALVSGYNAERKTDQAEKKLLKEVLCLVSLRFWLSRLADALIYKDSDSIQVKDPKEYEILLNLHRS